MIIPGAPDGYRILVDRIAETYEYSIIIGNLNDATCMALKLPSDFDWSDEGLVRGEFDKIEMATGIKFNWAETK